MARIEELSATLPVYMALKANENTA